MLSCAGFPPTFGPAFVNVYGSQREFSVLPSKYKLMDKGKVSACHSTDVHITSIPIIPLLFSTLILLNINLCLYRWRVLLTEDASW